MILVLVGAKEHVITHQQIAWHAEDDCWLFVSGFIKRQGHTVLSFAGRFFVHL